MDVSCFRDRLQASASYVTALRYDFTLTGSSSSRNGPAGAPGPHVTVWRLFLLARLLAAGSADSSGVEGLGALGRVSGVEGLGALGRVLYEATTWIAVSD